MKLKLDYRIFFHLVMIFPFLLAVFTVFGYSPFFITAPYFTIILGVLGFVVLFRQKIYFNIWEISQLIILVLLTAFTVYNFSSIRYSLPILFVVYLFVLQLFLSKYSSSIHYTDFKYFKHYLFFYLALSLFFIIVPITPAQRVFRFEGFMGSPTVYSAFLVIVYILAMPSFKKNQNKIIWYGIVFLFVLLSRTRLVLILMVILPVLYVAIDKWKFSLRRIFVSVFLVLFFLYPVYAVVVEYFPNIVSMRYEGGRDKSYDLRFYLYKLNQEDFLKQDIKGMLLGQGNEHSRLLVKKTFRVDLYPHNDFLRILNDWGIIGFLLFTILIYRYAVRSKIALLIAIMYLVQFYSNLVFNMFLISILVAVATLSFREELTLNKTE